MIKRFKKMNALILLAMGILFLGSITGLAADDIEYVETDGVEYGGVFLPGKTMHLFELRTEKEEVRIPAYIIYNGEKYRVETVSENYYLSENSDELSEGFESSDTIKKISVSDKTRRFSIEGLKWEKLEKVMVSKSVKSLNLGGYLKADVVIHPKNPRYEAVGNGVYTKSKKMLLNVFGKKTKINVKKGTRKIGDFAFAGCKKLSSVIISNTKAAPKISKTAFNNTKAGIRFYVKNPIIARDLKKQLRNTKAENFKVIIKSK